MPSMDVVSKTDMAEVENAVQGAMREVGTRFDFKGSKCSVEVVDATLVVVADDDLKLKQVDELIRGYLTRRKVDAGAFEFGAGEKASGNTLRQVVTIKQGIERDVAQKITKAVKSSKLKIQVAIQGDELRVSGKKRDDLQAAMAMIKDLKIDLPLQFINFRD
jgi:cyclic-di-GMP-binding protein